MKEFWENLFFVITHSAYLVPSLLLFVGLGFWYGCIMWLPCAWDLELALEEHSRLKGKITKLTLGEYFAFPKEGTNSFEFNPEKKVEAVVTEPEPKAKLKPKPRTKQGTVDD